MIKLISRLKENYKERVNTKKYNLLLKEIDKDPNYINKVKNQTEEMCLIAVGKDPMMLRHVKEQSKKVCKLALDKALSTYYEDDITGEDNYTEFEEYVEQVFKLIKNKSIEVCREVLDSMPNLFKYVDLRYMDKETEEFVYLHLTKL